MKRIRFISLLFPIVVATLAWAEEDEPPVEAAAIEVRVTVPDSAWQLEVLEVYQTDKEIIVISKISRQADAIGAQVITTLGQKLMLIVPDLPVRHCVMGKTWEWKNEDDGVEFIENRDALDERLNGAKKLPLKR